MKSRFFNASVAIFLTIVLVAPSGLLVAPPKAHAIAAAVAIIEDIPTWVSTAAEVIESTITAVASVSSDAALIALQVNAYVLQPLAFVLSGNLLKAMTAGTIAFVIGKANGTGLPQFVADIQASLQTVSDSQALSFFDQYIRSSQSPWNTAIISQLSKEYLNKTSLAGFWAQNMDTLRRTSPNIYGYLGGRWMQGGVGSWFALTTQTQNNPYSSYGAAQNQLAALIGPGVGGAVGARIADVARNGGFVSWCGGSDGFLGSMSTGAASRAAITGVDPAGEAAYDRAYNAAIAEEPDDIEGAKTLGNIAKANAKTEAFARISAANANNNIIGSAVAPGDPCTNADGTTGTIKTPGSVIVAGLNKALGGQQDNVARMGNVGPQINQILANIGEVLKTVQFASQILGGPGSGGLFGVDKPTPGQTRSALSAYANSSGNLGVTNSTVLTSAAALPSSGSDMLNRVARYETAISTIRGAANTASTNVVSLMGFCVAQQQIASSTLSNGNPTDLANLASFMSASTAQVNAAQTALSTQIAPVLSRTDSASTTIAAARALVQKIQTGYSDTDVAAAEYATDLEMLRTMPPSLDDLAVALQDSTLLPGSIATANPPGSLVVSGIYLIDRLNLIGANADALQPVCTAPAPTFTSVPIPTP